MVDGELIVDECTHNL